MDFNDLILAPYQYLGLIWGLNFFFLFYLIKKVKLKNAVDEWKPVVSNTQRRNRVGFLSHKYLVSLRRASEDKPIPDFILFVHNEVLYNLSQALEINMNTLMKKIRTEEYIWNIFNDEEVAIFLINPLQWLEKYTLERKYLFLFRRKVYSEQLKSALVNLIIRINNQILFRS